MRKLLTLVSVCLRIVFKEQRDLALENLALRQQLVVLKRSQRRIKIKRRDLLFWIWLSRTWSGWRTALIMVKPATVVGWHRRGFKLYWTKLSQRGVGGRPAVSLEVRALIRQMATANPLWGGTKNSWGVTEAWDQHFGAERFAIDASTSSATITNMAHISRQSPR